MADTFFPPMKCDGDGNLYFQSNPALPAIHKLNPKGERLALFSPTANPDLKIDFSMAFAVAPGGDLYELVFPHEITRYVFAYKADGRLAATVKLEPGFAWSPHRLAVFPDGNLLVSGSEYDKDPLAPRWPFTGIFASDGRLLKEVKLKADNTLHEMAVTGDARVAVTGNTTANRAVDLSELEVGGDGNAYLMRWTNPALFYVISAGGEVVREFAVDPGDSAYRPGAMHVTQNRIAILFWDKQNDDRLMKIVDLEGHDLATYEELRANGRPVNEPIGAVFACYTLNPERFTFFGSDDNGRVQLWIAAPR